MLPESELAAFRSGMLFVGEKGLLLADLYKWKLLPESQFSHIQQPPTPAPTAAGFDLGAGVGAALPGVARRLQVGQPHVVPLRLRRSADGTGPAGQRGLPNRRETGVGCARISAPSTAPKPTGSSAASTARVGRWNRGGQGIPGRSRVPAEGHNGNVVALRVTSGVAANILQQELAHLLGLGRSILDKLQHAFDPIQFAFRIHGLVDAIRDHDDQVAGLQLAGLRPRRDSRPPRRWADPKAPRRTARSLPFARRMIGGMCPAFDRTTS